MIALILSISITVPAEAQLGTPGFCVNATISGSYAGSVSPTSSTCANSGNDIAISATPAPGTNFESWTLPYDCYFSSGHSNTASTKVTCTASALPYPQYTVYANFASQTTSSTTSTSTSTTTSTPTTTVSDSEFCVNATLYQPGTGGSAYPAAYVCAKDGDSVSISGVPPSGYTFSSWFLPSGCSYASGYGNSASTKVSCTASTSHPKYIVAVGFTPTTSTTTTTSIPSQQFCVNTTIYNQNNGGTVYPISYQCNNSGQSVYVSATPAYGFSFYKWNLPSGCTYASGWGNSASTYVTCVVGSYYYPRYTVSAQFTASAAPEFCVNASLYSYSIGGGVYPTSYSCSFSGQSVAISASAPSGTTFYKWFLPSSCSFASGYYNTASTQVTCTASSTFPRYTVYAGFTSASTQSTATITLSRGWNLFSVPLANATTVNNTCSSDLASPIWQFTNGQYSKASSIRGGYGYWAQSTGTCTISFTGSPLTISKMPSLSAGWNLIGALNSSTSSTNMLGGCDVRSGPFGYSTSSNSYYNASQIAPYAGYFVNVTSACTPGAGSTPPAPP